MGESGLDLVVAGTNDAVLMVESEAKELPEEVMLGAVMFGHRHFQPVIEAIIKLAEKAAKEPRELTLRLTNIINRASGPRRDTGTGDVVTFGPFSYRIERGELRREDEMIRITEREREILTILAGAHGANVEREVLAGGGGLAAERTIDVQINRLRRKTEVDPANPTFLQTVRGVGYRLAVD